MFSGIDFSTKTIYRSLITIRDNVDIIEPISDSCPTGRIHSGLQHEIDKIRLHKRLLSREEAEPIYKLIDSYHDCYRGMMEPKCGPGDYSYCYGPWPTGEWKCRLDWLNEMISAFQKSSATKLN